MLPWAISIAAIAHHVGRIAVLSRESVNEQVARASQRHLGTGRVILHCLSAPCGPSYSGRSLRHRPESSEMCAWQQICSAMRMHIQSAGCYVTQHLAVVVTAYVRQHCQAQVTADCSDQSERHLGRRWTSGVLCIGGPQQQQPAHAALGGSRGSSRARCWPPGRCTGDPDLLPGEPLLAETPLVAAGGRSRPRSAVL